EWERAAGGASGRAYPWGDEFDGERCVAGADGPAPAASFLAGASPHSLLHCAGNVREWCGDLYDASWYTRAARGYPVGPARGDHRAVRGGSFLSPEETLRVQHRDHAAPQEVAADLGFRVARDWVD
ncbi:MAG: formylglycine-generating enzyme family protein, partial [Planctomycetota bacterium]